jgi:hypothetical protein
VKWRNGSGKSGEEGEVEGHSRASETSRRSSTRRRSAFSAQADSRCSPSLSLYLIARKDELLFFSLNLSGSDGVTKWWVGTAEGRRKDDEETRGAVQGKRERELEGGKRCELRV